MIIMGKRKHQYTHWVDSTAHICVYETMRITNRISISVTQFLQQSTQQMDGRAVRAYLTKLTFI